MENPDLVYDISTVIEEGRSRAWYIPGMKRDPVKLDGWIGSVDLGGDVNFFNLNINPHAHGSHTETLGHVCEGWHPISEIRIPFIQSALLITVSYKDLGKDGKIINLDEVKNAWKKWKPSAGLTALVVRTYPNPKEKKYMNFSSKDAPFFSEEVGGFLRENGITHWLVDLPSVDREEDGGALLTHRNFWGLDPFEKKVSDKARSNATISELLFIDDCIEDGYWSLAMQVASIANDAAPSRPLLMR
ncbi:MAG: cyclase family protein [Schleiferiaceae bacterium]|nr:cyclase family protein [Schleiferiaceae bacterium]MDG1881457.1 cyclase family protein [Schleiferiaceae bacterium]